MLASWSTERWDLTLEGARSVRQDKGMMFRGSRVHRDLWESGVLYASREGKYGPRWAAAGFREGAAQTSLSAAILRLWGTITDTG